MPATQGLSTMSEAIEGAENYYDWIFEALRGLLGKEVLEIGPGFGGMAERITAEGLGYHAIDIDPEIIARLKSLLPARAGSLVVGDVRQPRWTQHFRKASVDTVLSLNVLEHIRDDAGFLRSAASCAPGGRLVSFVPAMPALFGSLDVEAGHYRRYTPSSLEKLFGDAGLKVVQTKYFNGLGAFAWLVSARILRMKLNAEGTNRSISFYDRACIPLARRIEPVLRPFCGQSLVGVAEIPRSYD